MIEISYDGSLEVNRRYRAVIHLKDTAGKAAAPFGGATDSPYSEGYSSSPTGAVTNAYTRLGEMCYLIKTSEG